MPTDPIIDPTPVELSSGVPLDGVKFVRLARNEDQRGAFTEVFCSHWDAGIEPTQWSLVESAQGVLRGMHVHARHDEYFMVVSGRVTIGLHDLRPDSPTFGAAATYELSRPDCFVSFPRGLAHGWLFHEPTIHLQSVSESYVDYNIDDNVGCAWDDPELGIEWPFTPTIISPKAAEFPALQSLQRLG